MAAVSDHFPAPVFRDERHQAALADAARGDLRGQIAFAFARSAHVGEKNRQDVAHDAAAFHDFYGRDAQPFFINFAREAHGAGVRASDIGVVRAIGDVEQRPRRTRREDGHHHRQVGQVRAPGVGVVQQGDVSGAELECAQRGLDRHGHRAEMDGHVVAHGKDISRGVENGAGIVAALLDVGRKRGTAERGAHFFRDRVEEIFENFEAYGIHSHRRGSRMRFPFRSTRADQPGGISDVALYSVTMAGPTMRFPARRQGAVVNHRHFTASVE